jgi:Bacterial archaeo-eukaryotic release factor family 10
MLYVDQIESLERLPGTVLTVYSNIQQEDPARHLPVPNSLTWLRKEAKSIADRLKAAERNQFETQWNRIETFLSGRHPHEKALAIFAGPHVWQFVSLPVAVENQVRWGQPAISQLLLLEVEHKPYCVVVVDKTEARFLRYQFAEMVRIAERPFLLDVSQWKTKEMGHVTGQRVHKTRGSQRDSFEHRAEAQYTRLCRETAKQAVSICRKENLSGIFLVGASHLVEPVTESIPVEFRESIGLFREDLGRIPVAELSGCLATPIRDWERQRAESLVQNLLGASRGAITEPDELLAQLQEGMVGRIVVASDFPLSLRECDQCGRVDRSADPVCRKCGGKRHLATLKDALPRLARIYKTQLHVVDGSAATQLRELGGIGGWRRETKRAAAR